MVGWKVSGGERKGPFQPSVRTGTLVVEAEIRAEQKFVCNPETED